MRPVSLRNKIEFDRVFDEGTRFNGTLITAIIASAAGPSKLGIIVSGKFGGAAARNRVKRRIREAFRSMAGGLRVNAEIMVIPRDAARKSGTSEILADLSSITHRAGIT